MDEMYVLDGILGLLASHCRPLACVPCVLGHFKAGYPMLVHGQGMYLGRHKYWIWGSLQGQCFRAPKISRKVGLVHSVFDTISCSTKELPFLGIETSDYG